MITTAHVASMARYNRWQNQSLYTAADGLSDEERRVVQDGAVLGKTFTRQAVEALSGVDPASVESVMAALVRKEVLSIQADPRSPEHGQYGFLQDLMRRVAYEMLSMRDRRERHLAAAAYLERTLADDDEIVEVLASHYIDAYTTALTAPRPSGAGPASCSSAPGNGPSRWARRPRPSATTPRLPA